MKIEKLRRRYFPPMLRDRRWTWTPFGIGGLAVTCGALILGMPLIFLLEDYPRERIGEIAEVCGEFMKLIFHWVEDLSCQLLLP